jgi:peptide/nickel transport system ATP-binding protein
VVPLLQPLLQVTGLTVSFDGQTVVRNIDFSIAPGEKLALVGESGSGKTVSALSLLKLVHNAQVSGSALLQGRDLLQMTEHHLRGVRGDEVAIIFQEPMTALNPVYTIGFQIVETLRTHFDLGPNEAKARAIELITMVEIPNPEASFDKYPHQLSGGQRQRAMIAQSLACDPGLLVADEPTTALDVTVQAEILDLIRNLRDKLNSAILLITHDMGVVADLADDILVMKDGNTVEHGSADQIFNRPQHPYTQELLAAVPKLGSAAVRELSPELVGLPAVLSLKNVSIEYPKSGRIPAFRA